MSVVSDLTLLKRKLGYIKGQVTQMDTWLTTDGNTLGGEALKSKLGSIQLLKSKVEEHSNSAIAVLDDHSYEIFYQSVFEIIGDLEELEAKLLHCAKIGNGCIAQVSVNQGNCTGVKSPDVQLPQISANHSPSERENSTTSPVYKELIRSIEKIIKTLDTQTRLLHEVLGRLQHDENVPLEPLPTLLPTLPLQNLEELDKFEEAVAEPLVFQEMTKILAVQAGGSGVEESTRRLLKNLVSYSLAQHLNWLGQNNKRAFKELNAKRLIIHCIRRQKRFEDVQEKIIEDVIKAYLRYAPARYKYSLEKLKSV